MANYNITITSGAQGASGQGVPAGGTTGQFLKKTDGTDFNTEWSSSTAVVNSINDVNDVTITAAANGEILKWNGSAWVNSSDYATSAQGALAASATQPGDNISTLTNDSGFITSYTVTEGDVTAHQAALSITESQISDLGTYLSNINAESIKDLSDVFSSMTPTDGQVLTYDTTNGWQAETVASGVTDHTALSNIGTNTHAQIDTHIADATTHYTQAAISITESQISDLGAYLTDITGESLTDLSDVPASLVGQAGKLVKVNPTEDGFIYGDPSGTTVSWGDIAGTLANQTDLQVALDGKATTAQGTLADTATQPGDNVSTLTNDAGYITTITGGVLDDLSDVTYQTALGDNQIFLYNTAFNKWQNQELPTAIGATTGVSDLMDVTVTTPLTTQALIHNGSIWVNRAITESDISDLGTYAAIGHTHTEADITDLGSYILDTEKAAVNGVATLDGSGLIPTNQLPGLAITSTYVVASEIAQLALTVQEGDIAVRTDENKSYVALNATNAAMTDWQVLLTPTDAVQSVDGRTGTVTLGDLYAPISHNHAATEITSGSFADGRIQQSNVTQHQAALTITESQISNLGTYLTDITGENLVDLSNVAFTGEATGDILMYNGTNWVNSNLATDLFPFFNGTSIVPVSFTVTSNGTVVSANIAASIGGNFEVYIDDDHYPVTAGSIALTAGTDVAPVRNWVYVELELGVATIKTSTTGFPTANDYAPMGDVIVQSAASVQTDGPYKVHAWSDHVSSTANGHLAHINQWIRKQNATWLSGVAPTANVTTNGGSLDNLDFATTVGSVLQLHDHSFPAMDTAVASEMYVVNDNTTAYNRITDLNEIVADADGTSLVGTNFNIVVWGVASEDEADCKLMINLPVGTYSTTGAGDQNAIDDTDGTANYSIVDDFVGTGFLIARITIEKTTANGGTLLVQQVEDLRGLTPNTAAAGGGGGALSDHGLLAGLSDDDHLQYHTDARGDARYYTQTLLDAGQLDSRYYTETELDAGQLDNRYYTEAEVDANFIAVISDTVQTTDDTPTTLVSEVIAIGEEKILTVRVQGHEAATDDHIWKTMTFCVKNVAGTAALVGGVDAGTGYDAGGALWAITAGVSSGSAVVTVTGEIGHTIDWTAKTEVI